MQGIGNGRSEDDRKHQPRHPEADHGGPFGTTTRDTVVAIALYEGPKRSEGS